MMKQEYRWRNLVISVHLIIVKNSSTNCEIFRICQVGKIKIEHKNFLAVYEIKMLRTLVN